MSPRAELPEIALPAGARIIADLHLDPRAPRTWSAFEDWLARTADAPALVVLGDLFEYWTGAGQMRDPAYATLLARLRERARVGTALHFLHGNRDFLLGRDFERAVGGHVHPAGLVGTTPRGERVLCLHGDELATRDRSYQRLRAVLRSGAVRALSNATPAAVSAAVARALRRRSRRAVAAKDESYVELQAAAAAAACARHHAGWLVCGHAHRYRDELLPLGARWIVLDAFGGARDVLCVTEAGALASESSAAGSLRRATLSLSSPLSMIIALDGPAAAGKSTVARRLARELGVFFLDTGAMYRAVTQAALERGIPLDDAAALGRVARELELGFDREGRVLVAGRPGDGGEEALRGQDVTRAVSQVAAHPAVREAIVARQRALAAERPALVAEGRDTTTVVFPRADHKFYLSASAGERALRRALQENALERLAEIRADIERRDASDSSRAHSPLREADDAVRIETDGLGVEEVVQQILAHVRGERL